MLKSLGIFLALGVLVALLSACSDSTPPPTESDAPPGDTSGASTVARTVATPGSASVPTAELQLAVAPRGDDYDQATPLELTPQPSDPSAGPSATASPVATTAPTPTPDQVAIASIATPDQVTPETRRKLDVLKTSWEAMRELKSVHFRLDNIVSFEVAGLPAMSTPTFVEGDYQAPDRYRYDGSLGPLLGTEIVSHIIVIGPRMYVNGAIVMGGEAYPYPRFSLDTLGVGPLFPEGGDANPELLEGVTMMVTEFGGESVYYLSVQLGGEALRSALEDAYASQSLSGGLPSGAVLGAEGHTEIWIGVDDYLVRNSYTFMKQRFRDPSSGEELVYTTDGATTFSGYNEVVDIQAP